ncbi:MAG: GNAT family N-acetyltransferase [Anaerolineales bacterium]|nr:GNAT family N-acetyltransferase [Anaerolineales bacterium]
MSALVLRPVTDADEDFLYRVYAGTRAEEMARVPWDEAQKQDFLRMQFAAQQAHYRKHFPEASHDVLLADGLPAGRMYVDRRAAEIRILDIAVLPEARRQGVGSHFLRGLMKEAQAVRKTLSIYIDETSPSLDLFRRLGFVQAGGNGISCLMEWHPAAK